MNYSNNEIKNLYKQFFNIGQVGLLDKFAFSEEKITKAKGCYLYTESGHEILDMTSGFGTQNLGYNNSKIIQERIDFVKSYQITRDKLPKLYLYDPISRYYNMKIGNVVRIYRPSPNSGIAITYRVVVDSPVQDLFS